MVIRFVAVDVVVVVATMLLDARSCLSFSILCDEAEEEDDGEVEFATTDELAEELVASSSGPALSDC